MAATAADFARDIRLLDPNNVERWQWIADPIIPGWKFELTPVGTRFIFYTFQAATYSGGWLLSPIEPSFDQLAGHQTHVVETQIGPGPKAPIICRRQGQMHHENLREVKGTAGKFALYHSLRKASGVAPFSA